MNGKFSKVFDQKDQETAHLVWNPGSEYAICDCPWAKMGNLCEHVLKMMRYCRDKGSVTPSMSMFHYSRTLINMLHSPQFDSLVRDHAVSFAVWVQMQLNKQIGLESKGNNHKQQSAEESMDSPDTHLHNGDHSISKSGSTEVENQTFKKRKRSSCDSEDFGDYTFFQTTGENVYNNESQVSSSEIEAEPSPVGTSAPQLSSANEKVPGGIFVANREDLQDACAMNLDGQLENRSTTVCKPVDSHLSVAEVSSDVIIDENKGVDSTIGDAPTNINEIVSSDSMLSADTKIGDGPSVPKQTYCIRTV